MRTTVLTMLLLTALSFGYAQVREVAVGNFFFRDAYTNTSETVIDVGMTVRWVWQAGTHTTTGNLWNSNINSNNCCRQFEHTFTEPGDYNYYCSPHRSLMIGVVKVRIPGDVDFDGCVDDSDLLSVLFNFGATGPSYYDLNYDGVVDDADLLIVLFNFGAGC
jgi:hypothetical protein